MSVRTGSEGGKTAEKDHARIRESTPTTYYEQTVRIPGYGDPPDRCRPVEPVGFCDHGHTLLGRSSCGTRYCPDHWPDWLEDAVISTVSRLAAYRHSREDNWQKRTCHVVASPPQNRRYSAREMYDSRSDAYDALEAAGVRGGAVVTHPYRTTPEADRLYSESDTELSKWAYLRDLADQLPGDDWRELSRYVEAAPHYHALAPVEDVTGEAAPGDWVVENVRSFDRFDYEDSESYVDMIRTAYYVLTHGAVLDGRTTTTYFGEVHPATFDPEEELTPAVWRRIQRETERAVKGVESDDSDGDGCGRPECPREDCDAVVWPLDELPERMADDDWREHIRTLRDGRARLKRLRGTLAYWECRTDRPPPHARSSRERMREWLEERGAVHTPEPSQVSLPGIGA